MIIDDIVDNFKWMTHDGEFHSNELAVKFQDAFIAGFGALGYSGITVIHGNRSRVQCRVSAPVGTMDYAGELGDLLLLFYKPSTSEMRQLLLRFKSREKGRDAVRIPSKQFKLYNEHPEVFDGEGKYEDIFDLIQDENHAGTMFVAQNSVGELEFTNTERLPNPGHKSCTWELNTTPILLYEYGVKSSKSKDYCSYVRGLKEFLERAADMEIGRKISIPPAAAATILNVDTIKAILHLPVGKRPSVTVMAINVEGEETLN